MSAGSIAETGAQPGQWVKCVKMLETGHPGRFRVGKSYPVVDILGNPRCYGELVDSVSAEGGKHTVIRIPQSWQGFGYLWEIDHERP